MIERIKAEIIEGKKIFERIRNRDFSGNGGQIIKNSSYSMMANLIMKAGSFIFTVLLARILAPELLGLYSLTIATILLFLILSDLGSGSGVLTFASKEISRKKKEKASAYFHFLLRYKAILIILASIIIITLGYFLENNFYHKPIYYGLLAGIGIIIFNGLFRYLNSFFQSLNDYRVSLVSEIIFQVSRLLIVPLVALTLIKSDTSEVFILVGIIIAISICNFIVFVYNLIVLERRYPFVKKVEKLKLQERKRLRVFITPLIFMAFSGMFFSYIDMFMLGRYVEAAYIAYYGVAVGLVGSAISVAGAIPGSIISVFTGTRGRSLEKIFKKSLKMTFFVALVGAILLFLLAYPLIMLYGPEYSSAILILRLLSVLVILDSTAGVYVSYFTSIKKTKLVARTLIGTTIINILLNLLFIHYGISHYGMIGGVIGASIATVIGRGSYLAWLALEKRKI